MKLTGTFQTGLQDVTLMRLRKHRHKEIIHGQVPYKCKLNP